MIKKYQWKQFAVYCLFFVLFGCYYTRDIQNQTIGSGFGATAAGLIVAKSGGSLAGITAAVIGGSMFGSMFGQDYDNYSPLMRENPVIAPVHRYAYWMFRPTLETDCFCSGNIQYRHQYHLPYITHNPPTVNQLDPMECPNYALR